MTKNWPFNRLNLKGSLRESVVDTLREVVSIQAPYWPALRAATQPVPAEVSWLQEQLEQKEEEELAGLIISMSRAELKASVSTNLQPEARIFNIFNDFQFVLRAL
jgi:hypothetical protein